MTGHGGIRGIKPAEPLEERLRLRNRSLADGSSKAFQRLQVAGLLERVYPLLLRASGFPREPGTGRGRDPREEGPS